MNDRWLNGLNITAYVSWILSCMAGGWLGSWVPDPTVWGLDFALPAMFAALLVLQLFAEASKMKRYLLLIALTVVAMFILSGFMSSYLAVLISTIAVAAVGAVTDR